MRHLHRLRLAYDRIAQGQKARRSAQDARQVPRAADHRYARHSGPRQARGLLRSPRLPRAREVRHAGLAHPQIRPRERGTDGKHRMTHPPTPKPEPPTPNRVVAALKKVYDPEMPVNIYELGL